MPTDFSDVYAELDELDEQLKKEKEKNKELDDRVKVLEEKIQNSQKKIDNLEEQNCQMNEKLDIFIKWFEQQNGQQYNSLQ